LNWISKIDKYKFNTHNNIYLSVSGQAEKNRSDAASAKSQILWQLKIDWQTARTHTLTQQIVCKISTPKNFVSRQSVTHTVIHIDSSIIKELFHDYTNLRALILKNFDNANSSIVTLKFSDQIKRVLLQK
jgi:hypothetical protein